MIKSLELISRLRATPSHHQVAITALKIQRHLEAPHHTHHPSLWQGNQHLIGLRPVLFENTGALHWRWGVTPPPPHIWQVPVVEDKVWDGTSNLTEVVVTGPGKAILFYGQWSLGEVLSLGEVWDIMFMLLGATSWVGKQAKLITNPVSMGEGRQLMAQAITKGCIKPRGPGCLHSIMPALTPFNFSNQDPSSATSKLPTAVAWWEVPRHGPRPVYPEWGWASQWDLDWGQGQWEVWAAPPPSPLPSSDHGFESDQSTALTSSSVSSRLKDQEVPCVHAVADGPTGNPVAIWKSTCQCSRIRTQKTPSHTKVGVGTWQFIITLGARITPFSSMLFIACKVTQGSWWEVQGQTSLWMIYSPYWMSTTTMSVP